MFLFNFGICFKFGCSSNRGSSATELEVKAINSKLRGFNACTNTNKMMTTQFLLWNRALFFFPLVEALLPADYDNTARARQRAVLTLKYAGF